MFFLKFCLKYGNIFCGDLMISMICDDNILFFVEHSKYLDIFCYVVIFICLLCTIILMNSKFNKKENFVFQKIFLSIVMFMFLIFLLIIIFNTFISKGYEGCTCRTTLNSTKKDLKEEKEIKRYGVNKVIIVGDSRMEFIIDGKHGKFDIPSNFAFIAKSGAEIEWLETNALKRLKTYLNDCKDNKCHVVFNLGVNDFYTNTNVPEMVNNYFEHYKELANEYPEVTFYFLSVNPINDNVVRKYFPSLKATSEFIEKFNGTMFNDVKKLDLSNFKMCDSYHELEFKSRDGLHYDRNTGQSILNYITNHCIIYE